MATVLVVKAVLPWSWSVTRAQRIMNEDASQLLFSPWVFV